MLVVATWTCLATPAFAGDWEHFFDCGAAGRLRHYFYDPSTLQRRGQVLLVKIRGDYSAVAGSRASEVQLTWGINCRSRKFYEQSRIEYDGDKRVIARHSQRTAIMDINPPGISQQLFEKVCSPGTQAARLSR